MYTVEADFKGNWTLIPKKEEWGKKHLVQRNGVGDCELDDR